MSGSTPTVEMRRFRVEDARARVFGDDINTDYIISAARKQSMREPREAVPWMMEDIAPGFGHSVQPGDILVAGRNFGCGSSREAAPAVIKESGIVGVAAISFARIFFRNAVNIGLPLLAVDTAGTEEGDRVTVDFSQGMFRNLSHDFERHGPPLPQFMQDIMAEGGLVPYFRKHGRFPGSN